MNGSMPIASMGENSQERVKEKLNKKLQQLLENKEKFEESIKEGEKILPQRLPFNDTESRNDPRNDVLVCVRIRQRSEKEKKENLMETFIARNPYTFAAEVSFNFKNEPRVNYNKFIADLVLDKKTFN